jgi:dihydroneopterin aldolase
MEDSIIVSQLECAAHIGVSDAERAVVQRLVVSLRLIPTAGLAIESDSLAMTIDYASVCAAVRQEVQAKSRRLIETLAEEIASMLLARYPLRAVEIEVRKFVIPGAEYVAVSIRRGR